MNLEFVRNKSPAAETMLNIAAFVPEEDNPIAIIYPILSELGQEEEESTHCEFDVAATLKVLCCYSLISVNEERNEFRVHKLVQEVVRERLTPSVEGKIKEAVRKGLQKVAKKNVKKELLLKVAYPGYPAYSVSSYSWLYLEKVLKKMPGVSIVSVTSY